MFFAMRPLAAICLSLAAAGLHAQTAAYDFDLPAQPVDKSLQQIAQQAELQLVFADENLRGLNSPVIRGRLTAQEALAQALSGTGLQARFTSARVVAIRRADGRVVEAPALEPVTITATRTLRRVDEVPASVSVLTERDLATKNRQNAFEALRDVEGLEFNYSASVAQQPVPTIRGVGGSFAGSTTQALVNGMAHDSIVSNLMGHGGLNFTPVQDIEQVEVVRGPASALYGPGVIGGVINVIPKRWKGDAGVEAGVALGSHNTRSLSAATGTAGENFDVRLSLYDASSDGFKAIPTKDTFGQIDYGPRDWKDRKVGLLAGYRPADHHEVTLGVQTFSTDSAILGGRPNERAKFDGRSTTLGYRFDLSDTAKFKADLRSTHLEQYYSYDGEDWNGTVGDRSLAYEGGRKNDATSLQLQFDAQPVAGNRLSVGYSHDNGDYMTHSTPVGGTTSLTGSTVKADAIFVQDEQRLGAWLLSLGLRNDRLDFGADTVNSVPKNGSASVDNVVTPRLGARYFLSEATSFYGSYGQGYLPALNSFKYVQPSTTRIDNPAINPERSTTVEFGMNQRLGAQGTVRAAVFHTDYKDKITLGNDPTPGSTKKQWQNIAFVKVDGLELAWTGRFGAWSPYANFAYTQARDYANASDPGKESTRVSPRKFNAGATYQASGNWAATVNARAVSGMYLNSVTPAQWSGGYAVVDAKISTRFSVGKESWDAFFAVNNLGDRLYSDWNIGEFADQRTFTVGVNGRF